MNPVASRVLAVIESTGLSHRAFSAAVGIDPTKLSKSLHGARAFRTDDLARIAVHGQTTTDWLITGQQSPFAAPKSGHRG